MHYYVGYSISQPGGEDAVLSWTGVPIVSYWSTLLLGQGNFLGSGADGRSVLWHLSGPGWIDLKLQIGSGAAGQITLSIHDVHNPSAIFQLEQTQVPEPSGRVTTFVGAMVVTGPSAVQAGQRVSYRVTFTTGEVRFTFGPGPRYVSSRFVAGSGRIVNELDDASVWWTTTGPGQLEVTLAIPANPTISQYTVYGYIGGTQVCCSTNYLVTEILH